MLALYRSGRQADALSAYHRARRHLTDELGLEPSPELQQLQQAILRHDRALMPPRAALPPRPGGRRQRRRRRLGVAAAALLAVAALAAVALLDATELPAGRPGIAAVALAGGDRRRLGSHHRPAASRR